MSYLATPWPYLSRFLKRSGSAEVWLGWNLGLYPCELVLQYLPATFRLFPVHVLAVDFIVQTALLEMPQQVKQFSCCSFPSGQCHACSCRSLFRTSTLRPGTLTIVSTSTKHVSPSQWSQCFMFSGVRGMLSWRQGYTGVIGRTSMCFRHTTDSPKSTHQPPMAKRVWNVQQQSRLERETSETVT